MHVDASSADGSRDPADGASVPEELGGRIRHERLAAGLTVRGLAARIDLSPSLISQVERGRATPSVATLWAIASELGIRVGDLFSASESLRAETPGGAPVQRHDTRRAITLESGVRWERLTPDAHDDVDFLHVIYPVGAESCRPDAMTRHGGKEYGYVVSGALGVQVGDEQYVLNADDSIRFDAQMPHRLWAVGDEPVVAVWAVLNRRAGLRPSAASD